MVCNNCKENLERQSFGYYAKDLVCSCSFGENLFWHISQFFSLFFIAFFASFVVLFVPIRLMEKVGFLFGE